MVANKSRMVELSMVPPLANELGDQINGTKPKSTARLMENSAVGPLATELVRQMNAGVGNHDALSQAGMPPRLAREVATQISGGTPPLVMPSGMSLWWDPDVGLTSPVDGADYAGNWVDKINSVPIAAPASDRRPIYRAAGLGGKPCFEATAGAVRSFLVGRPTQLLTALGNYNNATGCTVMMVLRPGASTGNTRCVWSPSDATNDRSIVASADSVGALNSTRNATNTPGFPSGNGEFMVITQHVSTISSNGAPFICRNNSAQANGTMSPHPSNDYVYGASINNSNFSFVGMLADLIVWPRELTEAEKITAMKVLHAKYNQSLPWASAPFIAMIDGDSYNVFGGWAPYAAVAKSHPYYGYSRPAVNSRTSGQMALSAPRNYAGLAAAYGKKIIVYGMEFYNQPDNAAQGFLAYWAAVQSNAPEAVRVAWTATDNGQTSGSPFANRAGFNAAVMASSLPHFKIDIYTTAEMGIEGACPPDPGPYGTSAAPGSTAANFNDSLGHPSTVGAQFYASYMGPVWDLAAAFTP